VFRPGERRIVGAEECPLEAHTDMEMFARTPEGQPYGPKMASSAAVIVGDMYGISTEWLHERTARIERP